MNPIAKFFIFFILMKPLCVFAQLAGQPPRYERVKTILQQTSAQYPEQTELFELGVSDSGQIILGIKIGNGSIQHLLVGTHHGDESPAAEVALGFVQALAAQPIADQTIWIIPVLNIPGYNANTREERANGFSHDPNRDYPGPCGTEGPFYLRSTKALADLMDRVHFVASATLHTYVPAVLYPWGVSTTDTATPYDDIFISLSEFAVAFSGYEVGNSTLLLYPADGTFEDYAFWQHGTWSLLFEMGASRSPGGDELAELVRVNVLGLRKMFENAPRETAQDHSFGGQCNTLLSELLDLHLE